MFRSMCESVYMITTSTRAFLVHCLIGRFSDIRLHLCTSRMCTIEHLQLNLHVHVHVYGNEEHVLC